MTFGAFLFVYVSVLLKCWVKPIDSCSFGFYGNLQKETIEESIQKEWTCFSSLLTGMKET